ncbi:GlxA family transcriptional regulator [Wenzhouxiangella sediminis]|uniref:Helix-turn-helix domain-containing protein n=1 Tax=Wenzhouxiangella sediminis TaxID=1792836 RepID=A0A3E1K6V2_9GAMM|nr:helix-turn-helix domain-containing protein [Wenzhouxiangella sediminis]RFF29745.1 helix-turn-helix domain-containing protein [Wenzhouxiangella sediminis]
MDSPSRGERPIEIAILALDRATASPIYGMQELLAAPGRDWPAVVEGRKGCSMIDVRIASMDARPVELAQGAVVRPGRGLDAGYRPDAVCLLEVVLDPEDAPERLYAREIDWLRRYHAAGGVIATACTGALVLAETGLLSGLAATTHWGYCDFLARRHPDVQVQPDRILLATGAGERLIMAGGGTSWMDLGLYLIARFCGGQEAVRAAKIHLIDWHQAGQQAFAALAVTRQSQDALIANAQAWIAEHYEESSPVARMVELTGLNERTFKRRFRKATGMAPIDYVLTLRLEEAKQMLEAGEEPVEAIAEAVGYQDAAFFGRKFAARVGLTPLQYRRKFRGIRRLAG